MREARRLAQQPHAVRTDRGRTAAATAPDRSSRDASRIGSKWPIAIDAARRASRRRHAGVDVGLHLAIEMKLQLLVQLAIERRRSEPAAQRDVETMVPAHDVTPFVRTSPIAPDSRAHAASSCVSRFCPAFVSR